MLQHDLTATTNINKNGLGFDAWGRNKVVNDYSQFHAMFTHTVDQTMFITYVNDVEVLGGSVLAESANGLAVVQSGANRVALKSRRNPRYQPNRGHLYSSSVILPSKDLLSERNFGLFTQENGAFFRLRSGVLYAVIRKTFDDLITLEEEEVIDTTGIDLEKGNIYDIQMQWRGVGDIKFFINLKEVLTKSYIGNTTTLSIPNPALAISFEAVNLGDACSLLCGCADVSSEGGTVETKQYRGLTSGEIVLTVAQTPILLFHIPTTFNSKLNTRDCILHKVEAYSDVASLLRVYYTRDITAFTVATWVPSISGLQRYAINGNVTAVDYAKMTKLHETRVPANGSAAISNPDVENTQFYLSSGDYVLVTMQAKNNTVGGATLVYGEEV